MAPASAGVRTISDIYRDYLRIMTPTGALAEFLNASFDPEVQAPHLASIIESNPLYAQYLQKLDILQEKLAKWRLDFPEEHSTERLTQFIVVLLRTGVTRNTVLTTWINRHASMGLPKKPGVRFLIIPRTVLRYSIAASELCDENALAHADLAYVSGLCFDWVVALMEKKGGAIKSEKKYVEELWSEALKAAKIAYELAAVPKNLNLSHFAFSATLLTYLGKGLMAATFPKDESGAKASWRDFVKHYELHGARALTAQHILEKRRFPVAHAEFASLCASLFPMLRPAEKAIRYYQEPYVLKTSDRESFLLGAIISSAISLRGAKSISTAPAALTEQQRAWLKELKILDPEIQTALKRADK